MLEKISIPSSVDAWSIPELTKRQIEEDQLRIEAFQDRWDQPQIEQFVAADFFHVHQSLQWTLKNQLMIGNRFLEWGCGFAVVSMIASSLGMDTVGVEAERLLLTQANETLRQWQNDETTSVDVELVHGNFLPFGAEDLAIDDGLPSLGHPQASVYDLIGLDLDDFALVYSYPWPGEDSFHRDVFDRYGAAGGLLLMFCGPNDLQLFRKVKGRNGLS